MRPNSERLQRGLDLAIALHGGDEDEAELEQLVDRLAGPVAG